MLDLGQDEVHIWRASLDQPEVYVKQLSATLSEDERARAARFHFDRDQRRFIVGRGILRTLIGRHLAVEPRLVRFRYQEHGKPYLTSSFDGSLYFNLAHSNGMALFAFARGREVGIDLESIRPIPHFEQLAARYFSASEKAVLSRLPAKQKLDAFFACWTRKEAYLKATGQGLMLPLDNFVVSMAPDVPPQLLRVQGKPDEVLRWSMRALRPVPSFAAALVVEGHNWYVKSHQFQPGIH